MTIKSKTHKGTGFNELRFEDKKTKKKIDLIIYSHSRSTDELCPDWDEGSGDGVYAVTDKTIEDLELLPNLTKIIGIEHSEPSEKLLKAFEAKGILLEDEEEEYY